MRRYRETFPEVKGDKRATLRIGSVAVEDGDVWVLSQISFEGNNGRFWTSTLASRDNAEGKVREMLIDLERELEAAGWVFNVERLPLVECDSVSRTVSIVAVTDASHEGYEVSVTGEIEPNGEDGCRVSLPQAFVPLGVYQKGIERVIESGLWMCLEQGWSVQRIRIEDL
jgi:hypothetical protein